MTPPILAELKCPRCSEVHWVIDHEFRGPAVLGGTELGWEEREYVCPRCRYEGTGYTRGRRSPPEFFLQPHPMFPMTRVDFEYWVSVLRQHFPDDPSLGHLGTTWYPGTE
jgi:hypothetical protein